MRKVLIAVSLLLVSMGCVSNDQEAMLDDGDELNLESDQVSDMSQDSSDLPEQVDPSVLSEIEDSSESTEASIMEEETDSVDSTPLTDGESPLVVEDEVSESDVEAYKLSDSTTDGNTTMEPKPFMDEKEVQDIEKAEQEAALELANEQDSQASDLEKEYSQETLSAQNDGVVDTSSIGNTNKKASKTQKVASSKSSKKTKSNKSSSSSSRPNSFSPNNLSTEVEEYNTNSNYVTYVVQPNDTLGSISTLMYGTQKSWKKIADYNNIQDPNKVFPGDVLKIQKTPSCKDLLTNYQASQKQSYTVEKGDTLAKISQKLLHSPNFWRYIWSFNKKNVPNPNQLRVGQVLTFIYPYPSK